MDATLVSWLDQVSRTTVFATVTLFVVVNTIAIVGFLASRDRDLVNRWTGRILAIDLALVGAGVGVPLVTTMTRFTVTTVAASFRGVGFGGTSTLDGGANADGMRR